MEETTFDVIIIGAGISGINTAYRIQSQLSCTYTILEARAAIGGTWDLFRYPGIRSDSDIFTFGFQWQPWEKENLIAEADSILEYMKDAASRHGIDQNIQFNHKVISALWSSISNTWELSVEEGVGGQIKTYTARYVVFGTGYYDHNEPMKSKIPGLENFQGTVIHPQFWPEDLNYANKKVVVIGSGATAVTLIPAMADKVERVTMLQRSPSYIGPIPNSGGLISRMLPRSLNRIIWIFKSQLIYLVCKKFPNFARWLIKLGVSKQLPQSIPHDPHFKPKYNPWDQRFCFAPNADFFKSLHTGRADVKTDTIKEVKEHGILLDSGGFLEADVIVTATGLKIHVGGHIKFQVDKTPVDLTTKVLWRGIMIQDLPNAGFVLGYTNASWTLGADATATFVVRQLKYMENHGVVSATPRRPENVQLGSFWNLNSTYVMNGEKAMPKVGDRGPWLPRTHYIADLLTAKYARLEENMEQVKGSPFKLSSKV